MIPPEVKQIATEVRRWIEQNLPSDCDDNLCGACSFGSYLLTKVLQKNGYDAYFVEGDYKNSCHCWVELDDVIIDITATQFGNYPKIYITNNDDNYYINTYGTNAVREVKKQWFQGGWIKRFNKKLPYLLREMA
jgi:hypothetical protein